MNRLAPWALVIASMSCDGIVGSPPDPDRDPCRGGTCGCTAATEAAACGAHQYCDASVASGRCACVAGYAHSGDGCAWAGALQDPGLAAGAWTAVGGAVLDPTATGGVDPGEARFSPDALCALARIEQTVDMPAFAAAEPLVLELAYKDERYYRPLPPPAIDVDQVPMGVSFGGGWSPLPFFPDPGFHELRICVPEGGYAPRGTAGPGAPVTFAIGPYQQPEACPSSLIDNFAVDHAALVPARPGECGTRPGEGVNWDAEGTGGWTFDVTGSSSGDFAEGLGVGGSRAARLRLAHRCDRAEMTATIDVPRVDNPVLELFVGVGARGNATISFAELFMTSVFEARSAAAQTRTLRMCLPPSLRGQTMSLAFRVDGGGGSCDDAMNLQMFVDDLHVVDEPACATSERFTSPGFEQGSPPWGAFGLVSEFGSSGVTVRSAPGEAHGGTHYLQLESYGRCSSAGYILRPTVPASTGGGPALRLFAKVGSNPDAVTTLATLGSEPQILAEGVGYQRYTVCLDPRYAGRPQPVYLRHGGGSGACNDLDYVQQDAQIDDLEVTADPACPAQ